MKLYIAGPMSHIPEFNYPAFHAAEEALKALGYEVESPAANGRDGTDKPYDYYIRMGIRQLTECDGIALLPGWENSKGANLEVVIALELKMPVKELAIWLTR